jgi:hypothetical protein
LVPLCVAERAERDTLQPRGEGGERKLVICCARKRSHVAAGAGRILIDTRKGLCYKRFRSADGDASHVKNFWVNGFPKAAKIPSLISLGISSGRSKKGLEGLS